jgi:hypothetical protein
MRLLAAFIVFLVGATADAAATVAQLASGHVAYSRQKRLVAVFVTHESCCIDASRLEIEIRRVGNQRVLRRVPAGCQGSDCSGGERAYPDAATEEHAANRLLVELGFELPRDQLVCSGDCDELTGALKTHGIEVGQSVLKRGAQTFPLSAYGLTICVPSLRLIATLAKRYPSDTDDGYRGPNRWWDLAYYR